MVEFNLKNCEKVNGNLNRCDYLMLLAIEKDIEMLANKKSLPKKYRKLLDTWAFGLRTTGRSMLDRELKRQEGA